MVVDPGFMVDPGYPRAACQVSNGLREAAAHHRGRDQPLIVRPAAVPVHLLRHQPGTADRVRPLPAGPGPERTGGTSGRTRPDRWNIGPVTAHHAGHTGPCRPLVPRPEAAGPSCSPAVVFPRPGQ